MKKLAYVCQYFKQYYLPNICVFCRSLSHRSINLCQWCEHKLPLNYRACRYCAMPLASQPFLICGQCLQQKPPYQHIIAPLQYQRPINRIIAQLKHIAVLSHAPLLAHCFSQHLKPETLSKIEALIPIAMHPIKLKQRGFNQSTLLAKALSRLTGIPVDQKLLIKTRHTQAQQTLNKKQRQRNLINSVTARPNYYQHIALIDDVMTTGSTIKAAPIALQKTGIKEIAVWVIARA